MSPEGAPERRVLVVEDDPDVRELLSYNLKAAGYLVHAVDKGTDALAEARAFIPDLILLDIMLPDVPGTEVCRRIRADLSTPQPAIVMVTAKGDEIDRVVGFELGADDYVVKPFSMRELVLRVGSILRSRRNLQSLPPRQLTAPRHYVVGALEVDVDACRAFVGGAEIHLSAMEIRLLFYLLEHLGQVRSREALLEDVWGYSPEASTRTIDTHVKRLREKLGRAGALIQTVRGTGYRLSRDKTSASVEDS
ncbi:MAG TPA: response regulator transcription factor [Polyangia bacterium]|jgi:two-component system phosphate regulon response regulator PhoB|nr:response regulator transcription factor [Polyangia bacterium]